MSFHVTGVQTCALPILLAVIAQGQTVFNQLVVKNANLQAQFLPFVSFAEACLLRVDFRHSILPGDRKSVV